MNKIIKKIVFMFLALLIVSCVELDETPKDFVGPDNYYNTPAQVEAAFASSLRRLYGRWNSNYGYGIRSVFRNDDLTNRGDLVFSSSFGNRLWAIHYQAIADVNPVIGAIDGGRLSDGVSEDERNQLRGYATFLRAFNYFTLVRMYGDVPLIDENVNPAKDEVKRNPTAEVYDFIVKDLQFAVDNLPNTWPNNPASPTSGTAKGLLAKVYLTMASAPLNDVSKWALARDMAADVMDDGVYSLVPDVHQVFALDNENGQEILFSFQANELNRSTDPQIWTPGNMGGWGDFRAENDFYDDYPEQPRKDAYLITENWDGLPFEEWQNSDDETTVRDSDSRFIRKFIYDTRDNYNRRMSTQDFPLLRYADVLLIFAEAANKANGGPTQAAVDALNAVIDRANGGVVNVAHPRATIGMSENQFDNAVIRERALELCFEYDRWYDLVRKRILCDKVPESVRPNCDENDYLLPIPPVDISLNPLLTQNPGY